MAQRAIPKEAKVQPPPAMIRVVLSKLSDSAFIRAFQSARKAAAARTRRTASPFKIHISTAANRNLPLAQSCFCYGLLSAQLAAAPHLGKSTA